MSKLAIFLCAALFASAVDLSLSSDDVADALKKFDAIVEANVTQFRLMYNATNEKLALFVRKFDVAADSTTVKFNGDVEKIKNKAIREIDALVGNTKNVDITDCKNKTDDVHRATSTIIKNRSKCIDVIKEIRRLHENSIEKDILKILNRTLEINVTAHDQCVENDNGYRSLSHVVKCIDMARVNFTSVVDQAFPDLTVNVEQFTRLFDIVEHAMDDCRIDIALDKFNRTVSVITDNIKICLENKKSEARHGTSTAASTPEKVNNPGRVLLLDSRIVLQPNRGGFIDSFRRLFECDYWPSWPFCAKPKLIEINPRLSPSFNPTCGICGW